MLGIAILGVGDIANVHIEAYQALADRCEIRALVDIFQDKAEAKRQKYGLSCDVVTDYKTLLDRKDIDLVSICLPPSAHCDVAVDFLRAGKHVLCENPMAPSLEQCDRMIAAAKEGGAKLGVVAQNRFKPDIMRTKKLLESGVLGPIYFTQANSLWWRGDNYYDLWWRGTWEKEGGGCTFIHAVHHIDLFLWLMGDLREISAMVSNQNHQNSEVEDVSISTLRFQNGAVGTMIASLLHHGEEQKIIIDGENGSIEIPHKVASDKQQPNGYPEPNDPMREKIEETFRSFPDLPYQDHCGQIENMISAIENGTEPLITGVDGRKTVEFITAVYQSAFLGEKVTFPMSEKDPFYTKEGLMQKAVRFHQKTKSVENYADIGIKVGGSL